MNFYFVYVSSLPTNQLLYKELENYFRKSRAPLHKKYKSRISRIYTVRQPVNFRKAKNTFLFFHGTKAQNVGNILLEGLTIDPPNVKRTGAMFGQGLYFADRVSTRQLNIASQQVNTLSVLFSAARWLLVNNFMPPKVIRIFPNLYQEVRVRQLVWDDVYRRTQKRV